MEVEVSDEIKLEVEHLEDFSFLLHDILGGYGKMSDLFSNNLGVKWVNILILGSHVKHSYSKGMNILILEDNTVLVAGNEVLVQDSNCQKVGSLAELERGANLNHPVDHFSPILFGHVVPD